MKNIIIIAISLLVNINFVHADMGTSNIVEIEFNGSTFYTSIFEFYYLEKDTFPNAAYIQLESNFRLDSIVLFKKYTKIDLSKLDEDPLHILDDFIKIPKKDFVGNYKIKKVTIGNSAGIIYSSDINASDNDWIQDYEIEHIFSISDHETCDMAFFTIKNNLDAQEKEALRKKLQKLIMKNRDEYENFLRELYLQNILMIGFCSC